MAYRNFENLNRKTVADKLLLVMAFNIAKNWKCDGYLRNKMYTHLLQTIFGVQNQDIYN